MKALVLISGIVRNPEQSLLTLDLLRRDGFETDVQISTWDNAENINSHTWGGHYPAAQPSWGILSQYRARRIVLDNWELKARDFQTMADRWEREYGCAPVKNLGVISMYFGLQGVVWQSGVLVPVRAGYPLASTYDLVLRLRFDCRLLTSPLEFGREPGWAVPGGARPDDQELQDQVAFFWTYRSDPARSVRELEGYFGTYSRLDELIRDGHRCHPETLLYHSMKRAGVDWRRVPANWTINNGQVP